MSRLKHWRRLALALLAAYLLLLPLLYGGFFATDEREGVERHFQMRAHQWAWEVQEGEAWDFAAPGGPARIVVDRGDRITLHLVSNDVGHGFALPAFGVKVQEPLDHRYTRVVTFVADQAGRFAFRCNFNCGNQHPYMVGELVVRPNPVLRAGLLGVPVAALLGAAWALGAPRDAPGAGGGHDLLARRPWLRRLLVARWPQFAAQAMLLAGFAFAIFAGLVGLQNGAHNVAVVGVWLAWWFVLVAIAVPLTGRAWCGVCPLPLPGEWLARRRMLGPSGAGPPQDFRPSWPWRRWGLAPGYGLLLVMGATSMLLTTSPRFTAVALGGVLVVAAAVTYRYRGRAFCHHLCPIAPFLMLYGRLAPLRLDVERRRTCAEHELRECLEGARGGWGCPWEHFPALAHNGSACGYCLECLRTCSKENVTLHLRWPRRELEQARLRPDEVWGIALLVGLLIIYQLTMLGPYPALKDGAGLNGGLLGYLGYLGLLLGLTLALPAALWAAARLARNLSGEDPEPSLPPEVAARRALLLTGREGVGRPSSENRLRWAGAVGLLPLGLASWVAFKLPVFLANWVYLPRVASDPLGWGWNLFGTADYPGGPLLAGWVAPLQVALVLLGLAGGARLVTGRLRRAGLEGRALLGAAAPLLGLLLGLAALFIRLFGG